MIRYTLELVCDGCQQSKLTLPPQDTMGLGKAKEELRANGWQTAHGGRRHTCPNCQNNCEHPTPLPGSAVTCLSPGEMYHFAIHFDGGCVPNPGRGYGSFEIVAQSHGSTWTHKREHIDFGDNCTNNIAEYQALCCALEALHRAVVGHGGALAGIPVGRVAISIHTDSTLVRNCLNNGWKGSKPHIRKMNATVRGWLKEFGHWSIKWNPREKNVARFGH